MRVALVQCPAWGALPPLGPAALKAYLSEHGHQARCFDLNIEFFNEEQRARAADSSGAYGGDDPWGAESYHQWGFDHDSGLEDIRFRDGSLYNERALPIESWADTILAWSPDVIGFTTYLTSFTTSLLLARHIKERSPDVPIVFGGPQVARDQSGDVALRSGIPDLVVDGEGEAVLLEIADLVARGELDAIRTLSGTGYLRSGRPVWNERRPLITRIDELPYPDFSDYDWSAYPDPYLIPIMASRGCVLDCAFCYETVYWRRFRTQSPERVVDEMEYQITHHPMRDEAARIDKRFYFMFADSLVNGHLAGLRRRADLIIERGLPVTWGGQATINTKMDEAYFRHLKDAGCLGLAFGLESGSQRVLSSMGKHFDIDDAADFIRRARRAGVTVTVNVMVGYPNETFRDFLQTLFFLARVRGSLYQVSNVTTTQIPVGSALWHEPGRFGVTIHPDGHWTSDEAGDDDERDRRLRILHRWMKLLRIPHQEFAPVHRVRRRPLRATRRRTDSVTDLDETTTVVATTAAAPLPERTGPPNLLPFTVEGAEERASDPPTVDGAELVGRLLVDRDGRIHVSAWTGEQVFGMSEADLDGAPLTRLSEVAASRFGPELDMEWPSEDDPEWLVVIGRSRDGSTALHVSAVPVRGPDGTLTGGRFDLYLRPSDRPVPTPARR